VEGDHRRMQHQWDEKGRLDAASWGIGKEFLSLAEYITGSSSG